MKNLIMQETDDVIIGGDAETAYEYDGMQEEFVPPMITGLGLCISFLKYDDCMSCTCFYPKDITRNEFSNIAEEVFHGEKIQECLDGMMVFLTARKKELLEKDDSGNFVNAIDDAIDRCAELYLSE